jgi:hypothetical protein
MRFWDYCWASLDETTKEIPTSDKNWKLKGYKNANKIRRKNISG